MLKKLRSGGSNAFVWIILLLLIVGLAGFGSGGLGGGGSSTPVASVGEAEVTVDDYARAYTQENRRISQQFGRTLSPAEMQMFGLDQRVIGQLLNGAALDGEAGRIGISVGDETVQARLMRTQAFHGPDGKFSQDSYNFALEQSGLSPADYDEIVRGETTRQVLQASIMAGVATPRTAAEAMIAYLGQKRAVNWVRLDASNLETPVGAPNEDQLKAHYEAHGADYTLPEIRDITVAYVTEALLADEIEVVDDEIRIAYEERMDEFSAPARRLLDRIVFASSEEATAALARIEEGVAGFEDIARERGLGIEDIDLGEVVEVDLNPAERTLLFGAEDLGIYGPVVSDLGPALYRINAVLDATVVTFDDAKDDLRIELASQMAADRIAEAVDGIEDLLAGGATLEQLADETMLVLEKVEYRAGEEDGLAADQAFRDEAAAAEKGEERDLINLSDGIAVLRVDAVAPAALQPLDAVRADVARAWREAETAAQVAALGEVLKGRVDGGETLADIAAPYGLILKEEPPLGRNGIIEDTPPEFVAAIFDAELDGVVLAADNGSTLLAQVTEIVPEDMTSERIKEPTALLARELDASTANDIFAYFTQGLQDAAGVKVNQSLIQNVQNQLSQQGGN